jgi:hypothetical protein
MHQQCEQKRVICVHLALQVGGYRDVMLCVVYKGVSGLSIIGEIQVRTFYAVTLIREEVLGPCRGLLEHAQRGSDNSLFVSRGGTCR